MIRLTITLNTELHAADVARRLGTDAARWAGVVEIKSAAVKPIGRPVKYGDKVRAAVTKMAARGYSAGYISDKMHVGIGSVRKMLRG